ncbi:MAG: OmpA family protein [Ignavibacteria bacterium]|nr:OmpA family protein [Ignavibacteria bacterium]
MSSRKESFWIPYADLMTFLMLIFLFISVAFMKAVKDKSKETDLIVQSYKSSYVNLLRELQTLFIKEFRADSSLFRLDSANLSIKFVKDEILFDYDKSELKQEFKDVLDYFVPKFFNIVLKDEYRNKIAEIRIEGHTDDKGDYLYNLKLSQERARSLLAYIRGHAFYKQLDYAKRKYLDFLLTANGFSYGRTLDELGNLTFYSNKTIDADKSRRVEIRIVAATDSLFKALSRKLTYSE